MTHEQGEAAFNAYTAKERTRAFYYFFGWQGGTVHQIAAATGLSSDDILRREHGGEHSGLDAPGWWAIRTCSAERRREIAARHKGDWRFWRDAIEGFWKTGPIDGLNDRYATNHAH